MKLVHIAPFAPNRCGLYEHARDMIHADTLQGHTSWFVDAGVIESDGFHEGKPDQEDKRGNFTVITSEINVINEADIIIMHTGINDNYVVKTDAPMIWVLHGRPLACFRPENMGKTNSYSMVANVGNWKRTKKILYFWDEFKPHWELLVPKEKHVITPPVIDDLYYTPTKEDKYEIVEKGDLNILICDSIREDICLYETVINCIDLIKRRQDNIKIHFFGLDFPLSESWNLLLMELKKIGGLGDIYGRVDCLNKVYRSMDLLISPNRILTRSILEGYMSGLPIICQNGLNDTHPHIYNCDLSLVGDLYKVIYDNFIFNRLDVDKNEIYEYASKNFGLNRYGLFMNKVYEEVIK